MLTETAPPPYLTDEEIAEICRPLRMPAAQRRHLMRLGMLVKSKADGRPLVARAEFVRVMTGVSMAPAAQEGAAAQASDTQPNVVGLDQWARERAGRRNHGKKTQGR